MITISTGPSPVSPPPSTATPDPRLLSFEADLLLSRGDRRAAEWLSRRAEEIREAAR
jgi:hypothetical protein